MFDPLCLHELMGMPKYLLNEHVDLLADDVEPPWRPAYQDQDVNDYYQNDKHITGAVVGLHPLLDTAAVNELFSLLESRGTAETIFELDTHTPEANVHLVLEGRLRLVAFADGERPVEIGQCRPGQWIGMPSALREFDEFDENTHWTKPAKMAIKAIPLGNVETQSIPLMDLVTAMRNNKTLVRYVRQHVSIRFARREQILKRIRENAICRLLPPADQEYLMQLGVVRRVPQHYGSEYSSIRYLSAGKPSHRVSLVLGGKCTTFLPANDEQRGDRYVGKFGIADLLGHEAIVMPEEMSLGETNGTYDANQQPFEIREAPRATNVYASPGTEVLEFFWYAFRWTLDDRMYTWKRIVCKMLAARTAGPIPEIIAIQASRPRLGTSTLAHGLAATLADSTHGKVCIVDLQGAQQYERYFKPRGFTYTELKQPLQGPVRANRSDGRGQADVHFSSLKTTNEEPGQYDWPPNLELLWPDNPTNAQEAENLVELLLNRTDIRYVILCMRHDAASADEAAKELAMLLNSRCSTVLYVTDATELRYEFSDIEPPRLVWVERMTPKYLSEERDRMKHAMNEARYSEFLSLLPITARKPITKALGGLPSANENTDFLHRRQTVRVPDDAVGLKLQDKHGPHALVGRGVPNLPLKRALERLARVVTRQTVGLALGGGGAWGFCHVALLENLEEQNVPIDYVTGTSFGSIIGGLYTAGGPKALERLIEENSLDAQNPLSPLLAPLTSPLTRTIIFGAISAITIEWFINAHLRRMGLNGGLPIGLGTTEIPFYPISSNLTTYRERTEEHSTVGHGVRLSGTAPPMAPAFRLNGDLIVDGAFIANVPSRYLREIGADFVIAANAVPPAPAESPPGGILSQVVDFATTRFNDALRANQLLTWKAGEDQANLHADYRCDLRPKDSNVIDMWKGRAIMEQIRRDHFSGAKATAIRDAWKAFCNDPSSRRENVDEPDAGDGKIQRAKRGSQA